MPKKRERQEDVRSDRGRKMAKPKNGGKIGAPRPPVRKFTSFTSLTTPID